MHAFEVGDRVLIQNVAWVEFWANGATGTIGTPPATVVALTGDWSGNVRMVSTRRGPVPYYWVILDEPRPDEDGEGPFQEAEMAETWLRPFPPSPPG